MENLHNFKLEQLADGQIIKTRRVLKGRADGYGRYLICGFGKAEFSNDAVIFLKEVWNKETGPEFEFKIEALDVNLILEIQNPDGSFVKEDPITPQPYPGNPHRPEYSEEGNQPITTRPVIKKPPLGLLPRKFWEENRITDLLDAIKRFNDVGIVARPEWIAELKELAERNFADLPEKRAEILNTIYNFPNKPGN